MGMMKSFISAFFGLGILCSLAVADSVPPKVASKRISDFVRLGELKEVSLSVDDDDEELHGVLALVKRNGDTTSLELECRL